MSTFVLPWPRARAFRRSFPAAGLLLLLALTALSTFNAVTTERFVADLEIAEFIQKAPFAPLRGALFKMGVFGVAGGLMAVTCSWLWLRGNRIEAVLLALLSLPDVSSFLLRSIYDRPRPTIDLVAVYGGPQGASYPSGTTLHWIFFGGFMAYLLPKVLDNRRLAYGLGTFLILWALWMGVWVVHHGRHWPSDAFGGYLYGLIYLMLWVRLYPIAKAWEARHPGFLTSAPLRRVASRLRPVRATGPGRFSPSRVMGGGQGERSGLASQEPPSPRTG